MSNIHEIIKDRLGKEYPSNQDGFWQIYGEDQDPAPYGNHHEPLLDTVSGIYSDIIEYAFTLRGFVVWGPGGEIKKIEIKNIGKKN